MEEEEGQGPRKEGGDREGSRQGEERGGEDHPDQESAKPYERDPDLADGQHDEWQENQRSGPREGALERLEEEPGTGGGRRAWQHRENHLESEAKNASEAAKWHEWRPVASEVQSRHSKQEKRADTHPAMKPKEPEECGARGEKKGSPDQGKRKGRKGRREGEEEKGPREEREEGVQKQGAEGESDTSGHGSLNRTERKSGNTAGNEPRQETALGYQTR